MKTGIPNYPPSMVAFIDLLGYKNKVKNIRNTRELDRVIRQIQSIHSLFEKKPWNELSKTARRITGKKVIALSDALVISASLNSKACKMSGVYDSVAQELTAIGLSQGLCAMRGIFLRGGIALGYHYKKQDIIVSSALIDSYELEHTRLCFPVIGMDPGFYRAFTESPQAKHYSPESSPNKCLFIPVTISWNKRKQKIYCLDYFYITVSNMSTFYDDNDRNRYKSTTNPNKKHEILNRSFLRNEMRFVKAHKRAIEKELKKKHVTKIRKKYLWLKNYHNEKVKQGNYGHEYEIENG